MDEKRGADRIHIEQLEIFASVGVTVDERAAPQRLTISITLWPAGELSDCADDIAKSVNYSDVCEATKRVVADRPHKLIETLADSVTTHLLEVFPVRAVEVQVRKFVRTDAEYVSVVVTRTSPVR